MRFGIFTLDDWDVSGRTVLCRVDINQPVDRAAGTLRSTKRIEACVSKAATSSIRTTGPQSPTRRSCAACWTGR